MTEIFFLHILKVIDIIMAQKSEIIFDNFQVFEICISSSLTQSSY
jgi:hypothetical protein